MNETKLATDGKGRWYRRWSDGAKTYSSRLSPKEEAELQLEYGEEVKGIDGYVNIQKKPEQTIDKEVRDSLRRIITEDILQKEKDEAGLEILKRQEGGGVVRLKEGNIYRGDSEDKGGDYKVISDLYKKAKRGDKDAKQKLDGLWKLTIPHLKKLEKTGSLVIVGCPKCGTGIDPDQDCPVCRWSKYDSGYDKEFDEIMSGRKR